MTYTTLFFDLDDTLYPSTNGLWYAIRERMGQYMIERLGLPPERVPELRHTYFITYGTTLRGLQQHYQVQADDYLAYVHDLPLEKYLQPAPDLRKMLLSLPQKRWIFTNADRCHAQRVLAALQVSDCFEGIIDVRAISFACKPEILAYQRAMHISGEAHPQGCLLIDDSLSNLAGARQVGWGAVLVSQDGSLDGTIERVISDIRQLPQAMPELWR